MGPQNSGFPREMIIGFIAFRGLWAIYIHFNVWLPIGPLRWPLGAPKLHRWQHDRDRAAGNYANISPLMDLLFGTYRCPDHEPEHFGIEDAVPQNYVAYLIQPCVTFPLRWPRTQELIASSELVDCDASLMEASNACPKLP